MSVIGVGPLAVDVEARTVSRDGVPYPLGRRAIDLLLTLIAFRGQVVSRDSILKAVWPDSAVEDNNLQVHIVALRKALGNERDLIRTVPGRGYMLTYEGALPANRHTPGTHYGIRPVSQVFGRENDLDQLAHLLSYYRLVTLVGIGGVGKTTLATQYCAWAKQAYGERIKFVSLAPITEATVAKEIIRSALAELTEQLASHVDSPQGDTVTQALLILDNCEQILDPVADELARAFVAETRIRVLVTSRTSLGLSEEAVHHVMPLPVPPADADLSSIAKYDSIRLFLDRARRGSTAYATDLQDLSSVATICRKLDGIPLALELAANRSNAIGIDAVASRLDDRFTLLTNGANDVLPQHQTLKAVFDWSYSLLTEGEQYLFRYASRFAPTFSLDAAIYVMERLGASRNDAAEAISGLISKNLLAADAKHAQRFQFLESTRAYANERLTRDGQLAVACRFHAEYANRMLESVDEASKSGHHAADMSSDIDNVRVALAWAFGPDGVPLLAIQLAALAVSHFYELSLLDECTHWSLVALGAIERSRLNLVPKTKLDLMSAYAAGLMYSDKPGERVTSAWDDVLKLAEVHRDSESTLRSMWGLWNNARLAGEALRCLALARKFDDLVEKLHYRRYKPLSRRLLGMSLHYVGAHERGREQLQLASDPADLSMTARKTRCLDDFSFLSQATLARTHWLCGDREQALSIAKAVQVHAGQQGNGRALANVLLEAALPLALLSEESDDALKGTDELRRVARRSGLNIWLECADAFECAAHVQAGNVDTAVVERFSTAMDTLHSSGLYVAHPLLMLLHAKAYEFAGERDQALSIIRAALLHCKKRGSRWLINHLSEAQHRLSTEAGPFRNHWACPDTSALLQRLQRRA